MSNGIKIGNLDISAFKVASSDCKVYLGDTLLYPTTPPSFQGKWLATYNGGPTSSAECDASSAITQNEITKSSSLVSVEIGNCVTSIGEDAFSDCTSLTSIDIPNSVTNIGDWTFANCNSLTSVTIGSGLTSINEGVFNSCSGLTSITIPNTVTSIGQAAFGYCSGLTSITVNAATPPTLGSGAFYRTNNCPIYVPAASVNAYKAASSWSDYASRIQAIP